MMQKKANINEHDLKLLQAVVLDRRPSLLPTVERLTGGFLHMDEREELREVLADELLERGLREDGEPDAYGLIIDTLIGRLAEF